VDLGGDPRFTEITMLVRQDDCALPLLDTTRIHAPAAVDLRLGD